MILTFIGLVLSLSTLANGSLGWNYFDWHNVDLSNTSKTLSSFAVNHSTSHKAETLGAEERVCNTSWANGNCYEGDSCNYPSGNGICRRKISCESLRSGSIALRDLRRCTITGAVEIICCPTTLQTPYKTLKAPPSSTTPQIIRNRTVKTTASPRGSSHNRSYLQTSSAEVCDTTNFSTGNCNEKSPCISKSGNGTCEQLKNCEPFINKSIPYTELRRCKFVDNHEVICCPRIGSPPKTDKIETTPQISKNQNDPIPKRPSQATTAAAPSNADIFPNPITNSCNTISRTANCNEGNDCTSSFGNGTCTRYCPPNRTWGIPRSSLPICLAGIICCPLIAPSPSQLSPAFAPAFNRNQQNLSGGRNVTISDPISLLGKSCSLPFGSGICTVLGQCKSYLSGAVEGGKLKGCSPSGQRGDIVCCPPVTTTSARTSSTTIRPTLKPEPRVRPSKRACEIYKETNPKRLRTHTPGDREARDGEFPHVGVIIGSNNDYSPKSELVCGVGLVSQRFALTTANCARRLRLSFIVRFGSVDMDPNKNISTSIEATLKNIWIEDGNNESEDYNDLALLEFNNDVPLSNSVHPACLRVDLADVARKQDLQVNGWSSDDPLNAHAPVLYATTVNTFPLISCNFTHLNVGITRRFMRGVDRGQYCGRCDRGAQFDEGVGFPLVWDVGGQFEIVGIMSMDFKCSTTAPSIYSRVAYYMEWIEEIVWPELRREYVSSRQ